MTSERPDGSVELEGPHPKKHLPLWQETILLLVVALGLAILIKAVLVQAFYIPSESMEPGLVRNDRILVQKVSYWFGGSPERGDVVVFEDPGGWLGAEAVGPPNAVTKVMAKIGLYPSGGHLVKRVIGVAGDKIHCCDDQGRIEVNGVPLDEKDYARKGGAKCFGPRSELRLGRRSGAGGAHLRDGRQPQPLGRLVRTPVRRVRDVHPRRRVRARRPGGRQGLRAAVAAPALHLGAPARQLRQDPRRRMTSRAVPLQASGRSLGSSGDH